MFLVVVVVGVVVVVLLPFLEFGDIVATITSQCDIMENHPAEMMLDLAMIVTQHEFHHFHSGGEAANIVTL